MKNKKIVLGIFILIFLSYSISFFLMPSNSSETEIQNNSIENREVRNSAIKTATLRPNGDILTEWDGAPTPHWSRINEVSPDGVYARWIDGDENQTEIYAMETIPNINATKLYFISITTIEIHAYGHRYYTGPAFASINLGGWTPELELNLPTTGSGWRTCVWNNLDGTYAELRDLQVNITAGTWCSGPPRNGYGRIDTLYCVITYDIVELPGDTATIRPNEDILIEWEGAPTPHWSRINEVSPNGVYASWIYLDINQTDIFGMQGAYFENAIITRIELHAYGRRYYSGSAFASIYLGEWTPELELNLATTGSGWRTLVWNNLDGTCEELIDLQVKIKAGDWCSGPPRNGYGRIDTLYCVITIEELQLQIINPENKSYIEPMSGYYPAVFGFENQLPGVMPNDWIIYQSSGTAYLRTVDELDGHKKVLDFYSGVNGDYCYYEKNLKMNITNGTIEFWFQTTDVSPPMWYSWFMLSDGISESERNIRLCIRAGTLTFFDSTDYLLVDSIVPNQWYHLRIDFNMIADTSTIYLNNVLKLSNVDNYGNGSQINTIHVTNHVNLANTHLYLDAIGYSWDPHYNIGDNTKEGLLVSYQSNTNFNWTGYSLNSQYNITFFGNTTIPMPEDGYNTIQLFGNNSEGYNCFSEIIHFYVDISSPIITIASPSLDDFFGSVAPDFEISVDDLNVNTTWYNLNNGIKITIDVIIGTINQTAWEICGDGLITIRFYANDTWGHEGYSEVSIYKDITAPTSVLTYVPYEEPNIVIESTPFTIVAFDGSGSGIYMIQYKINDSSWMPYSDSFDLTGYSPGYYLITCQAIDKVGNVGAENTMMVKLEQIPSIPPEIIPGYHILISISIICIVSLILIRRLNQKLK